MKVVLDTNVIVSGILVPDGPPGMIVDLWAKGELTVVVSQLLIEEYLEVLLRPKFQKVGTVAERQALLREFLQLDNTVFVYPGLQINVIEDDPEDNHVLECAAEGEVQYIISGDDHLSSVKEFRGIIILTPADFLRRYQENPAT